ncbi:GID complex subunit containing RING finger motif, partial [Coemansia sp. RSA 2598]
VRQTQKQVERETAAVGAELAEVLKNQYRLAPDELQRTLDTLIGRLQTLKQSLEQIKQEESQLIQRSKLRAADLNKLKDFESTTQPEFQQWCRQRLDRVLIDYMLRSGNVKTAQRLVDSGGLEHFADSSLFALVMSIESELKDAHSCQGALQWCAENRGALRKIQCSLEFELHLQEYIEMIRARNTPAAILYAKKHLSPWSDTQLPRIQRAMTLLAFSP